MTDERATERPTPPADLSELLDLWRDDPAAWLPSLSACRAAAETPRQWGIGLGPVTLTVDLTDEGVLRTLAARLEAPSHVIVRLRGRDKRQIQVSFSDLADPAMWRAMRGESAAPTTPAVAAAASSLAPAPTDIVTLMLSQMMQERRDMQAEMRELQRRIVDRPPPPPPPDPIATIVQAVEGMRAVGRALPGVAPGVVVDDEGGGGSLLSMLAPLAPSIDRLVSSIARSIDVSTDTAAEERRERARADAERSRIDAEAEAEQRLIATAAQAGLGGFVRNDVEGNVEDDVEGDVGGATQ